MESEAIVFVVIGGGAESLVMEVGEVGAVAKSFEGVVSGGHGSEDAGVDGAEEAEGEVEHEHQDDEHGNHFKDGEAALTLESRAGRLRVGVRSYREEWGRSTLKR